MTSLEQAKALLDELHQRLNWHTDMSSLMPIIQKHIDTFANGAKAAVIAAELRIARLVGENAHLKGALSVSQSRLAASAKLDERDALEITQLKEANRELLKDKERLTALFESTIETAGAFKAWDSEAQEDYYFSASLAYQEGKKVVQKARAKIALDKADPAKERTE